MKRPAATLLIIGSTVFMLVAGLAAVLVVALLVSNLSPVGAVPSGPLPALSDGSSTAPAGDRLSDYSFGHTAAAVLPGGPGVAVEATQRIPFTLQADVTSMRLHVRNWNYIEDRPLAGTIDISAIAVGRAVSGQIPGDSSAFAAAPAVFSAGTKLTDGAEFVSDWIGADAVGFEKGAPLFLSLGFSAPADTELGIGWDVSWLQPSSSAAAVTTEKSVGSYQMGGSFLDIWMDYTYAGTEKLVVVAGHSLNSGANARAADHPHTGENSSWHQVWADQNGAVAASLSAPGSWAADFPADSPKWDLYPGLKPDAFVLWAASNDIAGGADVEALKGEWLASLARAEVLWPEARMFAFTEPGRGLTGQLEENRVRWNDWLRGDTSGAFTVVDADALLSDPDRPNQLRPAIIGDDAHPAPAGYALVADAFECAFDGC
ncbi:hypothetical protein B7R21_12125 [Subtercola boreus]|uniref:SGNH hydrolase-type esterase domain-containing protein n=1 Tax=Subtercola boreus TaxID=120213 RepID=A0A3E0VP58_9MICO|nr:GDSL-type esterase/lipase family protein [Subtercola boreus]RFA11455.1 hypothetical protein B7R21_12125 [Subtercola boreus]